MYKVKIYNNDNLGNGITKINNKVIFVENALKDEEVEIEIFKENKNYSYAKIVKIINPSIYREKSPCPYYNICGGCTFLNTTIENELQIKENYIKNLFKDVKIKSIVMDTPYNYRNKVTLHIKNNKIGYYMKSSNNLIEIDKCLLLDDKINKIITVLKQLKLKDGNIIIRKSKTTNEVMLVTDNNIDNKDLYNLINSYYVKDKLIYGSPYIKEIINNITYTIYPNSFFQVNTNGMIILYNIIKDYASKGDKLLDLYCGTGTIGIYLKDNFKEIDGIEISCSSIENALINKSINNIENINFKLGDASIMDNKYYDVISIDPPRSGLTKEVIQKLIDNRPSKIVYTSCNPNTLKRDINLLKDYYSQEEISIVNLFPRTSHIELVTLLKRR